MNPPLNVKCCKNISQRLWKKGEWRIRLIFSVNHIFFKNILLQIWKIMSMPCHFYGQFHINVNYYVLFHPANDNIIRLKNFIYLLGKIISFFHILDFILSIFLYVYKCFPFPVKCISFLFIFHSIIAHSLLRWSNLQC